MSRSRNCLRRNRLALVQVPFYRTATEHIAGVSRTLLASLALLVSATSTVDAQGRATSDIPLHLPVNRFEFVASGDTLPPAKALAVHNGGTVRFTDVRVVRLSYADSASGSGWLVAVPRQSTVAPDELATVGMLCVDATGLRAGTYRATAAVGAREVPESVGITITLVVTNASTRTRNAATSRDATARCHAAVVK